jgi:hypothetical protein
MCCTRRKDQSRCHKFLPIGLCNNVVNAESGEWEAVRLRKFFYISSTFDPLKCMWMSISQMKLIEAHPLPFANHVKS